MLYKLTFYITSRCITVILHVMIGIKMRFLSSAVSDYWHLSASWFFRHKLMLMM